MDVVHKQEFKIRDLATRSVTLFPARASVVREIKEVRLKPGINEITVTGITPTADEDSVKVEGTGSAVISDLSVELLPNRELFDEIHPESDEDSDVEDYKEDDEIVEHADIKAINDEISKLEDDRSIAQERVATAEASLSILDHHGKAMKLEDPNKMRESVQIYEAERRSIFSAANENQRTIREIDTKIREKRRELARLNKRKAAEKRKADSEKRKKERVEAKRKALEFRRKVEARDEKIRVRKEHQKFWPKSCYSVRITLDATSLTPSTSRRSSIASASDLIDVPDKAHQHEEGSDALVCDLFLTYITSSAFWSPSYDVQLSTTTDKAALCFDAKITNTTSESWDKCKVVLSTSQTTFGGLDEKIPSLTPWRIKLGPKHFASKGFSSSSTNSNLPSSSNILKSSEEQKQQSSYRNKVIQGTQAHKSRAQMFGVTNQAPQNQVYAQAAQQAQAQAQMYSQTHARMGASFGNAPAGGGGGGLFGASRPSQAAAPLPPPPPPAAASSDLFGSSYQAPQAPQAQLFGSSGPSARVAATYIPEDSQGAGAFGAPENLDMDLGDAYTLQEEAPELDFQESAMEETGLTTTYDIPGTKSLVPRSAPFKQRVARINLSNVYFSHTIVAKYKPEAYLKARLKNTSRITILKGRAGLTLDGTFLGQTHVPRCSIGDNFTLSLGIDPAVKVAYPKPEVRRSTAGVFSKEESSVFTRIVTITNTRSAGGKPVNVVVLDQVPVSEDERLKVELLFPKGLAGAERGVATGSGADKDWGRATALLKKNGEVSWDAVVNPGKSTKLALEYVVALPSGEQAVQV